ncbi:MAG: hypothetical protein HY708_08115 [Ignavibacteriae bacterium]|nr:hypothetical protein [Ignavibacteriota bacterium]
MKYVPFFVLAAFGALIIYASTGLPKRGDPAAPAHREQSVVGSPVASAYYIRNAERDADTPNIVTAILADYRSFDTMGEVIVVLTAGLCCYLVLRKRK